jgi:hypothetical protein
MSKVKDYTKLIISEEDVLVKRECLKNGSSLLLADDASEETKKAKDGIWGDPEIIKVGSEVKCWEPGQIITSLKQEYPFTYFSDEEEGSVAKKGAIRYYSYPSRLIDTTVEKDNYTKPNLDEL